MLAQSMVEVAALVLETGASLAGQSSGGSIENAHAMAASITDKPWIGNGPAVVVDATAKMLGPHQADGSDRNAPLSAPPRVGHPLGTRRDPAELPEPAYVGPVLVFDPVLFTPGGEVAALSINRHVN